MTLSEALAVLHTYGGRAVLSQDELRALNLAEVLVQQAAEATVANQGRSKSPVTEEAA